MSLPRITGGQDKRLAGDYDVGVATGQNGSGIGILDRRAVLSPKSL
jgi:hypothetical protein